MVCSRFRLAHRPVSSVTRPASIESCTEATISRTPELGPPARWSRETRWTSLKCVPGVDVHDRERDLGRPERLLGQGPA